MKFLTHVVLAVVLGFFSVVSFAQMININTATAEEMDKGLKGIGPVKAAEIVKYREANGLFKSVEDLEKVTGIKGKTLEAIKPMITVGDLPTASAVPAVPATPAAPATPSMPATSAMPTAPTMPVAPATSAVPPVTAPTTPATPAKQP